MGVEQSVKCDVGIAAGLCHNALVPLADSVELGTWRSLNGDASLLGKLEALSQCAFFLHTFGHGEPEYIAPSGAQTFIDRVATVD